jgi:hypothetical protein
MLISEWVEVKWNPKNIRYYKDKGYSYTKLGDIFYVKVSDLSHESCSFVDLECDYCGKTISVRYGSYIGRKNKDIIKKDCCNKCQPIKYKESNLIKYGVENTFQVDNIKAKSKETVKNKYGFENVSYVNEIKMKRNNTMYKNQSVISSRQQQYLNKILGGILNYSDGTIPNLDIAFIKDKIYIEYDGSGHELSVKYNNMTKKEFIEREKRRYYYLKKCGWKGIFIKSICDYLPSDEVIINEFNKALEWFKSNENGHSHYNIDIGNKINDEKYGKLRKITDKDLEKEVS